MTVVSNRHLAPTHPDAVAIHWPEPAPTCRSCGVSGHSASVCVNDFDREVSPMLTQEHETGAHEGRTLVYCPLCKEDA